MPPPLRFDLGFFKSHFLPHVIKLPTLSEPAWRRPRVTPKALPCPTWLVPPSGPCLLPPMPLFRGGGGGGGKKSRFCLG